MASAAAGRQQAACFKCGQVGHWGNACTVPREQWISQPRPAADAECYKCGRKGHYSRDCTAPRDQWVPQRQPGSAPPPGTTPGAAGGPAGVGSGDENNEPLDAGLAALAGRVGARKPQRKKPKLTVDDLRKPMGMVYIVTEFAEEFRRVYKGPGHEAGDLRRLLALYQGWHRRVFPFTTFDGFLEDLEKLGATAAFKASLRELRHDAVKAALEREDDTPPVRQAADDGDDIGAISPPESYRGRDDNGMDDFDDYLDNMDTEFQAAGAAPAAGGGSASGGRPQTASQLAEQEMDEFERMLAMDSDDEDRGRGRANDGAPAAGPSRVQVEATAEAAPAAPVTASQQAQADMDEFEWQLAYGSDPPDQPMAGAEVGPVAAPTSASQQAQAEADEFERQLAYGDDATVAKAAVVSAPVPLTASQQAEAEMDEFERQLAFGTQLAADAQPSTSQQAAAEPDDFELQLAHGDTQVPTAMQPVSSQQTPAEQDEFERQLACGDPQLAEVLQPTESQQAQAEVDEFERQLAYGETQLPADMHPVGPASPQARDEPTEPDQQQTADSGWGQSDYPPSSPVSGGGAQQQDFHHQRDIARSPCEAAGIAVSGEDAEILDAAKDLPGYRERDADGDRSAAAAAAASALANEPAEKNSDSRTAEGPSDVDKPSCATAGGGAVADDEGAAHAAAPDDEVDHASAGDEDMDLADLDDDDLLNLVMSQAEGLAGLRQGN